jgi:hypothetical protein
MATAAQPIRSYEFGVFTVDLPGGELRKHGLRLKVQERPFQLLVCLLERPGEIISRDELRQRLWPDGTFVDFDHNISSAINKLRTVLNDSASNPRYRNCGQPWLSLPGRCETDILCSSCGFSTHKAATTGSSYHRGSYSLPA